MPTSLTSTSARALGDWAGDVSLRSILGYTEDTQRNFLDFDGFQERILDSHVQSVQSAFSFEGQIRGARDDGSLNWVLGVFFRDVDTVLDNDVTIFNESALVRRFIVGNNRGNAESAAVYGQASWEFTEGLTLTGGYRLTEIDLRQDQRTLQNGACNAARVTTPGAYDFGVGGTGPHACGRRQEASFEEPSWTLGLDWQVDPDTLLYVVTRRGFAQGGLNPNNNPPADTFQPELLTDLEVGLKRDWEFRQR